ncbi:head-tail connector protein [Peptococcus simiae]|uniref:hypothetical protein n=1 Tax=Peptococcus simiae TaxID=1643805 RepID=UPI00397F04AF
MITLADFFVKYPELDISDGEFIQFKRDALASLDAACFHRLPSEDDPYFGRFQATLCELIALLKRAADEKAAAPEVDAETIGSYSVKYHRSDEYSADQVKIQARQIIKSRLGDTGLLYRGRL